MEDIQQESLVEPIDPHAALAAYAINTQRIPVKERLNGVTLVGEYMSQILFPIAEKSPYDNEFYISGGSDTTRTELVLNPGIDISMVWVTNDGDMILVGIPLRIEVWPRFVINQKQLFSFKKRRIDDEDWNFYNTHLKEAIRRFLLITS